MSFTQCLQHKKVASKKTPPARGAYCANAVHITPLTPLCRQHTAPCDSALSTSFTLLQSMGRLKKYVSPEEEEAKRKRRPVAARQHTRRLQSHSE